MKKTIGNYIALNRKKWCLSQSELGLLIGVSRAAVSKYEMGDNRISLPTALALEAVFGLPARQAYPDVYARRLDQVMRAAARLDARLARRKGPKAARRKALLAEMIKRAN